MQARIFPILLLTAVVALYWPTLFYDFAYDDTVAILRNPAVISPDNSFGSLITPFQSIYRPGVLYRPVTVFTYRLNYLAAGLDPFWFHLVNIALHSIVTILVFELFTRLLRSKRLAFCGALFFAVHPLHVETVANIIGRAELLVAFLGLSALLISLEIPVCARWYTRLTKALLAAVLLFLATLSKESAVVLLLLIPITSIIVYSRQVAREAMLRRITLATLIISSGSILALALRWAVLRDSMLIKLASDTYAAANPLLSFPFLERIIPALVYLGRYLSLFIAPQKLSADYSLALPEFLAQTFSMHAVLYLCVLGLWLYLVWQLRQHRFAWFGVWALVGFTATANLFFPIGTIMGERLAYLPSIGMAGFAVSFCDHLFRKFVPSTRLALGLAVFVIALYATRSAYRMPVWQNNDVLFAQTVIDSPLSPKAHLNYALSLREAGELDAAIGHARRSFELMPTAPDPTKVLFDLMLRKGELGRAEFWGRKTLELAPGDAEVTEKLSQLQALKQGAVGAQ